MEQEKKDTNRFVIRDPWPFIIFAVAFAVRLAYIIEMRSELLFNVMVLDSEHYDTLGRAIAAGDWVGGSKVFYNSPFYAYFLAVVYKLFTHDVVAPRLIQIAAGAGTWSLAYLIGRDAVGKSVGICAGLLGALYGYAVFIEADIAKNGLAMFTFTAAVYGALLALRKGRAVTWLMPAFMLGLTVINQPNALLTVPVFCVAILMKRRMPLKIKMASLLVCLLLVAGVTGIVTMRNYAVAGDPVLVSFNGGPAFFLGNNPAADGTGRGSEISTDRVPMMREAEVYWRIAEERTGTKLTASGVSRYWFDRGTSFVRENPGAFAALTFVKTLYFWHRYEIPDNLNFYYMKSRSGVLKAALMNFGIIAPLALVGLVGAFRAGGRQPLLASLVLSFMCSVVMFYVVARYRVTVMPLLCVFAGIAVDDMRRYWREGAPSRLVQHIAAVACLAVVLNLPVLLLPPSHMDQLAGDIHAERMNHHAAVAAYREAMKEIDFDKNLMAKFTYSAEQTGEFSPAIAVYRQLLIHPDVDAEARVKIWRRIERLYRMMGDERRAVQAERAAAGLRTPVSGSYKSVR